MKQILLISALALGASCDHDMTAGRQVSVDGREFTVYPGRRYPDLWYSTPSDRSVAFRAPPGVRAASLRAIEAVTGCPVIPHSIDHIDGISTTAAVAC